MIVGYIYISLGESYYKSSIYINQFDNYDFILKKSTQDKLDELVLTQTNRRWYLTTQKERTYVTFLVSSLNKNGWELLKTGQT